ncbi:hypothetical protein N7495_004823 [Penicillium taxi]|uniref:uncharacterized protein n=1 Tax=Penicillium taxi TaxID=168475 RepID=UPI0025452D62|nr:uncharacterized protein N7495_004823 [Penicillium taxi]KAJ5900079.1 hypothetical protein N7495_004823 [Penicillium taxi]
MSTNAIAGVILAVLVLYVTKILLTRKSTPGSLPPGPPGIPLLGNIFDLPASDKPDWEHWTDHKTTYGNAYYPLYGPISSLTVMGKTMVILNDMDIAKEILEKRSKNYSSRPELVFASEMVGWKDILAMQTNPTAYRKAIHPCIGTYTAMNQFDELLEVESQRFLLRVLAQPKGFIQHIRKQAGAIILKIAYGYTIEPHKDDPLVDMAELALGHFSRAGTPGAWLVDIIPALKHVPSWLPGAGFKRLAQAWKNNLDNVANVPYAFVQQGFEQDNFYPSYLSHLFQADESLLNEKKGETETEKRRIAKWTAASLYTGGADTVVSSMETFFLAMTLFPEVQEKAQKEIDRVLGHACRLPTLAHRTNLPYINAVVKETLRWHPVAPMGIPHLSVEDDKFDNYFIPKGSIVMANIWAMTQDPETYANPTEFKPERFLQEDGRDTEPDPENAVFGFGRRICPGRALANNLLFLSISQSLAAFNIQATGNSKTVDLEKAFSPGVVSHPVPFDCNIEPRSKKHEELVKSVEERHPWETSNAPAIKQLLSVNGA